MQLLLCFWVHESLHTSHNASLYFAQLRNPIKNNSYIHLYILELMFSEFFPTTLRAVLKVTNTIVLRTIIYSLTSHNWKFWFSWSHLTLVWRYYPNEEHKFKEVLHIQQLFALEKNHILLQSTSEAGTMSNCPFCGHDKPGTRPRWIYYWIL